MFDESEAEFVVVCWGDDFTEGVVSTLARGEFEMWAFINSLLDEVAAFFEVFGEFVDRVLWSGEGG